MLLCCHRCVCAQARLSLRHGSTPEAERLQKGFKGGCRCLVLTQSTDCCVFGLMCCCDGLVRELIHGCLCSLTMPRACPMTTTQNGARVELHVSSLTCKCVCVCLLWLCSRPDRPVAVR